MGRYTSMQRSISIGIIVMSAALAIQGCSREPAAWEAAIAQDTATAYEAYLGDYPNGEHAPNASSRIADFDWETVVASVSIESLAAFIQKHPADSRIDEARRMLTNLEVERDWTIAVDTSSAAGFHAFLEQHPDGSKAREAKFMQRLHEKLDENAARDFQGVVATITGYDAETDGIAFDLDELFNTVSMRVDSIGMQEASKLVHPPGDMVEGQRIRLYMASTEIDVGGGRKIPMWTPIGFQALEESGEAPRE